MTGICYNGGMESNIELMDALFSEKVLAARQRPWEEKFLAGGALFEAAIERMRIGILMDQPEAGEEQVLKEIQRRLAIARQLEART